MLLTKRAVSEAVELAVAQVDASDVFSDIVRVHHRHRTFSRAGQVIVVSSGDRRLFAVARGAPRNDVNAIYLDLRSREKLGVKPGQVAEFVFSQASAIDEFRWAWGSTDAMPRVAARLGILSVFLGALGLLLGGWSLWLTVRS